MTDDKTLPTSFTKERPEALFQEIVHIYNLADEVLAAVSKKDISNRGIQADLATPFVTQATNSANILSAYYTEVMRKNRPITADLQDTVESAFRAFFEAYQDLIDGMEEKLLSEKGNI